MTTTQPTQNEQDTVAALVTQQEAERIAAELKSAMDIIGGNLQALHVTDDTEQRLEIAKNTYEWCSYLSDLTANSNALTGSAISIAKQALEQRDKALNELKELAEAVENINQDHPLVEALVEAVEEGVSEYVYDQAYDTVHEEITEDLIGSIAETLAVPHAEADMYIDAIRGAYYVWGDRPTRSVAIERFIERLHALKARIDAGND